MNSMHAAKGRLAPGTRGNQAHDAPIPAVLSGTTLVTAVVSVVTPPDLTITPRDRRFGRGHSMRRWWLNDDPIATAFYNALSVTFPKGESYFVDSVRRTRDGVPPKLASEIEAFIKQEVMHTREHLAFNRHVVDQGYETGLLDRDVDAALALTKSRPPIAALAATTALEHFTAMLAHELIANPKHLAGADEQARALWLWHAAEEIEHKGVAYDTWLHATRDWSKLKRWSVKSLVMLVTTWRFFTGRARGMLELLRQDGLTGPRVGHGLSGTRLAIQAWLARLLEYGSHTLSLGSTHGTTMTAH